MNERPSDQQALLARLLEEDPSSLRQWLGEVNTGKRLVPAGFNWLGLAQAAADNARSPHMERLNLEWARAAVGLYGRHASEDEGAKTLAEDSSMMLRAAMIGRFGPVRGDAVLDPEVVLRWFTNRLGVTLEHAQQSVSRWGSFDKQERSLAYEREIALVRELRAIKNRLRAIDSLSRAPNVALTDDLRQWLALRERLP